MGKSLDTASADRLVRRSSRANKGRHSKYTPKSPTGNKKRKVDVVEDDEGEIRCLCGDNEDDGGFMIQCETCQKWQHGGCMGFETMDDVPESYACEQCQPDSYKDLKAEKKKEEKEEKEEKESPSRKKKLKTGKEKKEKKEKKVQFTTTKTLTSKTKVKKSVSPASEPPSDGDAEDENMSDGSDSEYSSEDDDKPLSTLRKPSTAKPTMPTPPPPPPPPPPQPPAKRKLSTPPVTKSPAQEKKKPPPINTTTPRRPSQSNARRTSTPATPSTPAQPVAQTPLATTFSELSDQRRVPVAKIFAKIFEPSNPEKSEALGLAIEHALYATFATSEPGYGAEYKNRFRSISFNLKDPKNTSLRERVLNGSLPPEDLVKLSNEELANQELRAQAEKIREEGVAQSVLKVQTGPRIRRTHKGEELIGEETPVITPTEGTPMAPFASTVRDVSPTSKPEEGGVPASPKSPISQRSREASPRNSPPDSTDTAPERKPSTFNLENVWERLRSPATEDPSIDPIDIDFSDLPAPPIADPDLDRILGKEEADTVNSPPYSPSAYAYDLPPTEIKASPIWKGDLSMPLVAQFHAQAHFIGGPLTITDLPWSQLLSPALLIDGRIPIETTNKYLVAQRVSASKDIIALQLEPADEGARAQHEKLVRYFEDRQRWGVLTCHSPLVKDAYIVPLSVEAGIPEVVEAMDTHEIPRLRTGPYLIAILVVQKNIPVEVKQPTPPPAPVPAPVAAAVPVNASPETYTPPTTFEQPPPSAATSGVEALGLSAADLAALQTLFLAHPEIVQDPQISTNPAVLQAYIQQYLPNLQ
jgi:Transcription factor S-II (TFIIS), central domain/SPOC domain/PHD-finger